MSGLTFVEFDQHARHQWLQWLNDRYVKELQANGLSVAEATSNAMATISRLFPDGNPAKDQLAGWAVRQGEHIGELWIGPHGDDPRSWWVWWVQVFEEFRGQHLGRELMDLCESLARSRSVTNVGLQVMGDNHVARSLYRASGYYEAQVIMRKELTEN